MNNTNTTENKLKELDKEKKKVDNNIGLVVAELIEKRSKKTKEDETFYVLNVSIRRAITEMVLELRGEQSLISANSKEPFFVFANRGKGNKYAYTLEVGCIYAFWFTKFYNTATNEDYFHVRDWRKLGHDKRSIERTLRLALPNQKGTEEEEEEITNRELLAEVERRIKDGKISFKISAVNSDDKVPLEIDTDLKDNESNFRINLQDKEENENKK